MARVRLVRKLLAHSLGTTQLVVARVDTASLGMVSQAMTKQAMVRPVIRSLALLTPATTNLVEIRSKAASNPRTRAMVMVVSRVATSRAATIKVEVNLGPVGNHGISSSGNVDTECH